MTDNRTRAFNAINRLTAWDIANATDVGHTPAPDTTGMEALHATQDHVHNLLAAALPVDGDTAAAWCEDILDEEYDETAMDALDMSWHSILTYDLTVEETYVDLDLRLADLPGPDAISGMERTGDLIRWVAEEALRQAAAHVLRVFAEAYLDSDSDE